MLSRNTILIAAAMVLAHFAGYSDRASGQCFQYMNDSLSNCSDKLSEESDDERTCSGCSVVAQTMKCANRAYREDNADLDEDEFEQEVHTAIDLNDPIGFQHLTVKARLCGTIGTCARIVSKKLRTEPPTGVATYLTQRTFPWVGLSFLIRPAT